jgi:hypothetical protein
MLGSANAVDPLAIDVILQIAVHRFSPWADSLRGGCVLM